MNWLNRILERYGERRVEALIGIVFFAAMFVIAATMIAAKAVGY